MQRHLPLIFIIGLLIAFRIFGSFPGAPLNFQPLTALFFCGAMLAPGWRGLAISLCIWAITYPFGIGPVSDLSIFLTTLLGLSGIYLIGYYFSKKSIPALLLGSGIAALVFHLITNGIAWLGDPIYEKSFTGLWQSLWTGPIGSPIPSWVFLRNLVAANFIFTGIFAISQVRFSKNSLPLQTVLAK